MKTTSATADFDQRYQTHLKLKGLQPKTIDAYSRAIRRMGDYFDHKIDNLSPAGHQWGQVLHSHNYNPVSIAHGSRDYA